MTDLLQFVPDEDEPHLDRVMLGGVEIGTFDRERSGWVCRLPNGRYRLPAFDNLTSDREKSRASLTAYVKAWLHMAGLVVADPGQARCPDVRADDAGPVVPPATGQTQE